MPASGLAPRKERKPAMEKTMPVWQRIVCGRLAVGGVIALIANPLHGSFGNVWNIAMWPLSAAGV